MIEDAVLAGVESGGRSMSQGLLVAPANWSRRWNAVLPKGFSPGQVRYGFSVTKIDSKIFFGVKGLYPTLFPGGRLVTRIPFTQSESVCSKPVSASGPLCLHSHPLGFCAQPSHTAVLWASLLSTATTPASALLSWSLAALPPCWTQSTGQSSFYWVNSHVLPTGVQWSSQPGPGENPGHRNSYLTHKHILLWGFQKDRDPVYILILGH